MAKNGKQRRERSGLLALAVGLALGLAAGFGMPGCSKSEEECLVHGENCTQSYKQANYGTTSIQCCQGQCTDKGSGILTCG